MLYCNNAAKDCGNLYDPCFLLPLFSTILRPGEYFCIASVIAPVPLKFITALLVLQLLFFSMSQSV